MKKTHKGLTLVEVLVSIAVFTIISLVMFSSFLAMRKVVYLQEEYTRLEMACHDINAYWDMYGDEWDKKYFQRENSSKEGYLKYQNGVLAPFISNNADYVVTYDYYVCDNGQKGLKIISINSTTTDREYLTNIVYCGESKKANMEVTNE